MKKILLGLVIALGLFPMLVFAKDIIVDGDETLGNTGAKTETVEDDDVITVKENVTLTIPDGYNFKTLTIKLNGKNKDEQAVLNIKNATVKKGKTLTIIGKDVLLPEEAGGGYQFLSKIVEDGTITVEEKASLKISGVLFNATKTIVNKSTLTLTEVGTSTAGKLTIENTGTAEIKKANKIFKIDNKSELTLSDTIVENVVHNGKIDANVTIEGKKSEVSVLNEKGNLTVIDAKKLGLKFDNAAENSNGENIYGTVVVEKGEEIRINSDIPEEVKLTIKGGKVKHGNYGERQDTLVFNNIDGIVNIEGGTFEKPLVGGTVNGELNITGGTFGEDVKKYIPEGYTVTNIDNADTLYKVQKTGSNTNQGQNDGQNEGQQGGQTGGHDGDEDFENPETFDGIASAFGFGGMSLTSLLSVAVYLKKKIFN